jgi:hypothetical protein
MFSGLQYSIRSMPLASLDSRVELPPLGSGGWKRIANAANSPGVNVEATHDLVAVIQEQVALAVADLLPRL